MQRAYLPCFSLPTLCLILGLIPASAQDFRAGAQIVYSRPSVSFQTNDRTVEFGPDVEARPGIEVRYRNYGFSFSTSLDDATSAPRFVSGGWSDFRTFYYGDAWGFEAYHREVSGFSAQGGGADSGRQIAHPGMSLTSTSGTVFRTLNRESKVYRLSDGLSTPGVEPDLLMMFGLSQNHLRDDVPFLQGTGVHDSRFDGLDNLDLYSASAGAGLALSINANGVYFDPALFAGFGMQYRQWNGKSEASFNLVKVNFRMRLGYRCRWFDLGAGFENDAHATFTGDETAVFNALVARGQLTVFL